MTDQTRPRDEVATLGGGCFWCLEAVFKDLEGVRAVRSGYAGGHVSDPTYKQVCTGRTGHAEVVNIEYDANIVTFDDLLDIFWICHDPTTQDRQGPDFGTQYRSIILYHNDAQRKAALKSYQDLVAKRAFRYPIVTQLVPLTRFYRAEDYHQDYYGGKPRTTSRRRTAASVKSKSAQSKSKQTAAKSKPKTPAAMPAEKAADVPAAPDS